MELDLNMSTTKTNPEEMFKEWANKGLQLTGSAYINKTTGTIGFFIHPVDLPSEMVDIYISNSEGKIPNNAVTKII